MCNKPHYDDLAAQIGKSTSYSHDAKVTAESTLVMVRTIEKLLYKWHEEDALDRVSVHARLRVLEGRDSRIMGATTTAAVFATSFISGIAWFIHYCWGWITGLFKLHGA